MENELDRKINGASVTRRRAGRKRRTGSTIKTASEASKRRKLMREMSQGDKI